MVKSLHGSISKLFKAKTQHSLLLSQVEEASATTNISENMDEVIEEPMNEDYEVTYADGSRKEEASDEDHEEPVNENVHESILDLEKDVEVNYDPGLWGSINDTKRVMIVQRGPIKILKKNDEFPSEKKSERNRSFSSKYYIREFPNGEKHKRKWLVYSNELNRWVDLQKGLKLKATIDKNIEAQIDKEKTRWKMILVRIIAVVKTLSRNSLPFCGTNEKIYEKNNGLFCQLIEFLVEFNPIIQDHVRRVVDKEVQNHYLSHKLQNELIILLANEIKAKNS
ncbi:uncharacterized protein LOC109823387 [Asparagus officinalis]|uniref:uncharacterized protein LOC109823387 n=1 Tax=Asparagus officinalis TaxID=4686 RepID=UPI00098E476E|nr:uncharacterized protein LOC109823387 [Asparagus officinalis]